MSASSIQRMKLIRILSGPELLNFRLKRDWIAGFIAGTRQFDSLSPVVPSTGRDIVTSIPQRYESIAWNLFFFFVVVVFRRCSGSLPKVLDQLPDLEHSIPPNFGCYNVYVLASFTHKNVEPIKRRFHSITRKCLFDYQHACPEFDPAPSSTFTFVSD